MSVVPVSSSIVAASYIAGIIQQNYFPQKEFTAKLLKSGINDTYLLQHSHQYYICRVYCKNWRTPQEIAEEIRLLQHLHQQHISVSYALPDVRGQYMQTIMAPEGERYVVLFTHAPGNKTPQYAHDLHYRAGELMAHFHQATKSLSLKRVEYHPHHMLHNGYQELTRFMQAHNPDLSYMASLCNRLIIEFSDEYLAGLSRGVVHMDIWFDNFNIDNEGKITLFDFDFCGHGWQGMDVAYYQMQTFNTEKDPKVYHEKLQAFFNGYQSISSFTEEEKHMLPSWGLVLYFFYLGVQCSRYENWSNHFLNEAYLSRYISQIIKRYAEYYQV